MALAAQMRLIGLQAPLLGRRHRRSEGGGDLLPQLFLGEVPLGRRNVRDVDLVLVVDAVLLPARPARGPGGVEVDAEVALNGAQGLPVEVGDGLLCLHGNSSF